MDNGKVKAVKSDGKVKWPSEKHRRKKKNPVGDSHTLNVSLFNSCSAVNS